MTMLSAKVVGEQLGLSARKVYDLARSGALVSYRFGDAVRFDQVDVDGYKESCRVRVAPADRARAPMVAVSRTCADSSLAAYFREAGLKPRATPASAKEQRAPRKAVASKR